MRGRERLRSEVGRGTTRMAGRGLLATIVLDYRGGTYVSQVEVARLRDLPSALGGAIDWAAVRPRPSRRAVMTFLEALRDEVPVALVGLIGVWYLCGLIGDHLASLTVVHTVRGAS